MSAFDYIIIGAGTAGCLLANRLSADSRNSVLVLEAGERDKGPLFKVPIAFGALYANPRYNYCMYSEPEPGLDNRRVDQPRGKVLGGTSAINGMIYARGQREDFDHWAALGNTGWSYDEVLPYFKRHERNSDLDDDYHNSSGEYPISNGRFRPDWTEWYLEAAESAGIVRNPDINGASPFGIDYAQLTQLNGSRYSSARTFIEPVEASRSNLTVLTKARVSRLLLEGQRVTGVEVQQGGDTRRYTASKETILGAGTFHSPQILMLSGIGDAAELQALGIGVAHHLPGVGKNLQEHIGVDVVHEAQQGLTMRELFMPHRLIASVFEYLFKGTGMLTFPGAVVSGFVHSSGDFSQRPNIQLVFSPAATLGNDDGSTDRINIVRGLTSMAYPVRPDARGTVSLRSANIDDDPVIRHHFLQSERDCREMIESVRLQRSVFAQPCLQGKAGAELLPGATAQTDEEILAYARSNAHGCYHPVGTCKMGNDDMAVVDSTLRLHGLEGLRIVDGSIMPTVTSGNTNAPIAMIAEKAASMILANR